MKKECWSCGQKVYKKDVGETRNVYPGPRIEWLCKTCQGKRMNQFIEDERERLGLPSRANQGS